MSKRYSGPLFPVAMDDDDDDWWPEIAPTVLAVITDPGGGGGGDLPEWLPAGAVVFSDFAADNHYADGAEATLGDIWEENTDWSVWNTARIVPDVGITADPNDAAPTMKRALAAPLIAGNYYVRLEASLDVSAGFEIATADLPNYSSYREVHPNGNSSGTAAYTLDDFNSLGDNVLVYAAYPNITTVVAITPTSIRVSQNGSGVQSFVPADVDGPLTDLAIGILGSDGSAIKSVTYWLGVPSDATMQALSLVGGASLPANVTPPVIGDFDGSGSTSVDAGIWSGNPIPAGPTPDATFEYQWYKNDVAVDGATNSFYSSLPEDSGQSFKLRETATNPSGSASAFSNSVTAP